MSFDISGILALFVYGSSIRRVASDELKTTVSSLSEIVEAYVYVMLGLAWRNYDGAEWGLSVLILLSCVVARVVVVFAIGACLRRGAAAVDHENAFIFSMCSVRGAISCAMYGRDRRLRDVYSV